MYRIVQLTRTGTLIILMASAFDCAAQQLSQQARGANTQSSSSESSPQPRYLKAFVINERLSALRRGPDIQSEVIRRLRLARPVFILATSKGKRDKPRFCRVAVTRRTRGWIVASALTVPGRAGEEQRILTLIEHSSDSADKITLCRLIIDRFGQSRFVPRAMLLLAEEAERLAKILSQRTRRRLADLEPADASLRDYFLSDAGLDRYSRLGIVFDFNDSSAEFIYDGKAYRDIVRRFPRSEEAALARQRIDLSSRKTAQVQ